ncbi:MAG: zinc-dependent metalloprotease [Actinobacteria bacterium]|nr:zinc-dependent metalloprotease [Actinomycetota bacterium]
MAENHSQGRPVTLLEGIFNAVDAVARRIVDFIPLSRGIRNAVRSTGDGLIGWEHVREIAVATLELQQDTPEPIAPEMIEQYQVMLEAAGRQVAGYTGLELSGLPETVMVFRQEDWIDANIVSFRFLFDPITEKYVKVIEEAEQGQFDPAPNPKGQRIARAMLTVQVGIIMGYLARNVLGQFDLSLPEPDEGGKLYVVETNVRRIDLELGLHPREFRQWITLHEVTHSFEFHCNDWLRGYIASTMQEYLDTIDWRGLSRPGFFRKIRENNIQRDDALKAGGLIAMIASPEQREILRRMQAVMSVLEGYSNHVMDQVGKDLLATYSSMKERFERRREHRSGVERLFRRLIGIDLKLQQYKIGKAFVDEVVRQEDVAFLNRVWESPDAMPSLDEIMKPSLWIERIKHIV